MTASLAERLAAWTDQFEPDGADRALAERALLDTVAVTVAARGHRMAELTSGLGEPLRLGAIGHVLDFDDLHLESTAHISVVCVPAALSAGGGADAYLAGAGVMARLGMVLGWQHYAAGWHLTCTTGAIGAAVAAAVSCGLGPDQIATAIALAVPASGGVQRAFGSDGKSLQVGFAIEAGLRAAALAGRGATADPAALDDWVRLMGGDPDLAGLGLAPGGPGLAPGGPAVPGGLAIKMYPACYALQRPIACVAGLRAAGLAAADVARIVVRTPEATVAPLIHHRPLTGLQGKFSMEYGVAAALLDVHAGFGSFTDEAVARPPAQDLLRLVSVELTPGGGGLLDGQFDVDVTATDGRRWHAALRHPPGSPARPPDEAEFAAKLGDCLRGSGIDPGSIGWHNAAGLLRAALAGDRGRLPGALHGDEVAHARSA